LFAAIQYKPPKGNVTQALHEIEALLEEAVKGGAKLIVLPEMATTGYIWPDKESILPLAETKEGKTFQTLSGCARKNKVWIVCGYVEKDGESLYNAALVIDSMGNLICNYRKILLYDADHTWATPGRMRYLIETPFGVLTPSICMDLNDNSFLQFLWKEKPDIVAFCTNWLEEGTPVLQYWQQRLHFWNGWFLAANSWGPDGDISFCGQSAILNSSKEAMATAPQRDNHILYAPLPSP
jgi:predicted amidohydrolase